MHKETNPNPHSTTKHGKGSHGDKPFAAEQDLYHVRLLQGNYLELKEHTGELGLSTTIQGGGYQVDSGSHADAGKGLSCDDPTQPIGAENETVDEQILKTVRVEHSNS